VFDVARASEFSSDHVLEHVLVQRHVGDQVFQLAVLALELLQAPQLTRFETPYFLRHLQNVCSLTPYFPHTSSTGTPS
jgi:hypothetical protein